MVAAGPAANVLIDRSGEVDVLVLGHRGRGGFASMLLGSVSLQCVLHAQCPVIVVRPAAVTQSAAPAEPAVAATPPAELTGSGRAQFPCPVAGRRVRARRGSS